MRYSPKGADDIHDCVVMICQACGLDKPKENFWLAGAEGLGLSATTQSRGRFRLCYALRSGAVLTCHWHVIHYRAPSSPSVQTQQERYFGEFSYGLELVRFLVICLALLGVILLATLVVILFANLLRELCSQ